MSTCSTGAHCLGDRAFFKHPVFWCLASCLIRYGSTSRAPMTIGGSRCACQKRRVRESKPCRRHWSFFTLKKSGIPLRPGHRRGRFPSDGSTACARFSRRAPIADFVWVWSAHARPERELMRRFLSSSHEHSGTALPDCGTSCPFWVIGLRRGGFGGGCENCSAPRPGPRCG
jgi:hypothetical protein